MNVVHSRKTRNNTVRAIPITENYLIKEKSGMLRWVEPNDSFSVFANTGGNKQLVVNIQHNDSEHSADLFLYTNIKSKNEDSADLMEHNRVHLDRTRNWYVRQFNKIERPGIKRFSGLPLNMFLKWWREPISLDRVKIEGLNNHCVKFSLDNWVIKTPEWPWFNLFLAWKELQDDFLDDPTFVRGDSSKSNKIMPWMHKHCRAGFIPFSDYDSMFVDPEEEVLYMIDILV